MSNVSEDFAKVHFLGIGSPRSGTTWLAQCLRSHPQIYMPVQKELYFFSNPNVYKYGLEWYKKQFLNQKKGQIAGEFTTDYYLYPTIVDLALDLNPQMKFIIALRHPVERAFSHYLYIKRLGVPIPPFSTCIDINHYVIEISKYAHFLENFFNAVGSERIQVVLFDDIVARPHEVMVNAYSFLGVQPNFIPPFLYNKINGINTHDYHVRWFQRLLLKRIDYRGVSGYEFVKKIAMQFGIETLVKYNRYDRIDNEELIEESDYQKLLSFYRADTTKLEDMLQLKLSTWKR